MTPGFDEAVVEIKNDDGRYQVKHVCKSLLHISAISSFHLGFWCDITITDKRLYYICTYFMLNVNKDILLVVRHPISSA